VWLEDYLSKWNKILFMVSHSQDFMNNVCTHIVHHTRKQLNYYSGRFLPSCCDCVSGTCWGMQVWLCMSLCLRCCGFARDVEP
jgi:hypothetical protein